MKVVSSCLPTAAALMTLPLLGPEAVAAISCGDVLTENTRLTEDLECDCNAVSQGLEVVGPAALDLGGNTVKCVIPTNTTTTTTGIKITGENCFVHNGFVEGFYDCVEVAGDGGHRVTKISTLDCSDDGIQVESDNNSVKNCNVVDTAKSGIALNGVFNKVTNCFVFGAGDEGIRVDGDDNTITKCEIEDVKNDGIDVVANRTTLTGNRVSECGDNGIEISGKDNQVIGNESNDNDDHGIVVQDDGGSNFLRGNKASGNTEEDLDDEYTDCGTNSWKGNRGTSNQTCIR